MSKILDKILDKIASFIEVERTSSYEKRNIRLLNDSTIPNSTTPSGDTYFVADRSNVTISGNTGARVSFGVGQGGLNHGVWSNSYNKWLIYGDASDTTNKKVYVNNIDMSLYKTAQWFHGSNAVTTTSAYANVWQNAGLTVTVPSQCVCFAWIYAGWNKGRPIGLGFHTETTLPSSGPVRQANEVGQQFSPLWALTTGTYYTFVKRDSGGTDYTNTNHVYILKWSWDAWGDLSNL